MYLILFMIGIAVSSTLVGAYLNKYIVAYEHPGLLIILLTFWAVFIVFLAIRLAHSQK